MRIHLLRHGVRPIHDPTFFTELTTEGYKAASTTLCDFLREELGDGSRLYVYSSPLIRCLQTVAPFVEQVGGVVRRDFSLYERVHSSDSSRFVQFDPNNFRIDVPSTSPYSRLLDSEYASSAEIDTIKWDETVDDVRRRASVFRAHLKSLHEEEVQSGSDVRILVVTHLSVINAIRGVADGAFHEMGTVVVHDI